MLQWFKRKKKIFWSNILICDASFVYTIHSYNSMFRRLVAQVIAYFACACVRVCVLLGTTLWSYTLTTYGIDGCVDVKDEHIQALSFVYSLRFLEFKVSKYSVRQKYKELTLSFCLLQQISYLVYVVGINFFIYHQTLQSILLIQYRSHFLFKIMDNLNEREPRKE